MEEKNKNKQDKKTGIVYITENENMFVGEQNLNKADYTRFSIETDIQAFKEKIAKLEAELLSLSKGEHSEEIEKDTPLTHENNSSENATNESIQPVTDENVLPSFAVMTKDGMKHFENMRVTFHDKQNGQYYLENGNEKLILPYPAYQTLLHPENIDKTKLDFKDADIAEATPALIEGTSKIPEFAMITNHGLQVFKDFVYKKHNENGDSYTLSNGNESITVSGETFREITEPERFEKQFDEKTPAYEKLLQNQYDDFFKQRDNTANNFIHNLKVYSRKECNSPLDALRVSKEIISRMDKEEQKKTKLLLQNIEKEDENITDVIVRSYYEAIKELPLNEKYIRDNFPDRKIARPFYDTVSDKGKPVDEKSTLKIGDTIKDIAFNTKEIFGHGNTRIHQDLQVISSSKEGNSIILMDKNRSYYNVPRDTFLEEYNQQQKKQHRTEQKDRSRNEISMSY